MTRQQPHQKVAPGPRTQSARHLGGAPLLTPAIMYVLLAVIGIVVPPVAAEVSPYTSDAGLLGFYTNHQGAAHLLAFCLLASSVPFVVFTAVVSHRVLRAGFDVPGRLIALVGGTVAASMLALSGLTAVALLRPGVAESDSTVRALNALGFAAGGPGFVVFSGLLLAGISIPALIGRLTPRWIGWLGLVVAVVCEVASLTAASDTLDPLLPVGRLGTMVWMLATAIALDRGAKEPRR